MIKMRKMFLLIFYGSIIIIANIYYIYLYLTKTNKNSDKEKDKHNNISHSGRNNVRHNDPTVEPCEHPPFRSNPPDSINYTRNKHLNNGIIKDKKRI